MTLFFSSRRRTLGGLALGVASLFALSCGSSGATSARALPISEEKSTVGPGDVFTMEIVGERDLPKEYQVASDGTVDVPYLQGLNVNGLEPQAIARLIREQLIERQILKSPSVVVQVKEYNSRKVTVMGQVAKPGVFSYSPGLTLIQALSQAGGLTGIANLNRVNLTRRVEGGSRTVVLSIDSIIEGRAADVPLQAGDRIFVQERIF